MATRRRLGHVALAQAIENLSERDWAVLDRVGEHRFLTTHQVQQFCFTDHQTPASGARVARRVLARLDRCGLLRALDRRVGGVRAGSAATIWQLTSAGQRATRDRADAANAVTGEPVRRRPTGTPSQRFLRHCLAVADVHILLTQHRRIEPVEDVTVEVEPASWRTYTGLAGEPRWLQPDLYACITTSEFLDRVFVEVDLGTESTPTLLRKCEQYEHYRRSGTEQTRHGSFPVVLWFVTTDHRARKLAMAIQRSSRLTAAMYRIATPATLPDVLAGGTA